MGKFEGVTQWVYEDQFVNDSGLPVSELAPLKSVAVDRLA
jgi:hypothetical protein